VIRLSRNGCVACTLLAWAAACSRPPKHVGQDVLTVDEVRKLDSRSLTSRVHARIDGRITYVDVFHELFVQDSTGGILVVFSAG
jgi:hypothetical protein